MHYVLTERGGQEEKKLQSLEDADAGKLWVNK